MLKQPKAFRGGIMVYSAPDGAEIYIDGTPATYPSGDTITTPAVITDVPVGIHYITFKLPGYIDETKIVEVIYSEWVSIDAELQPITSTSQLINLYDLQPAPGWPALPIPQIPYGYIVATTIPDGADIYLDGQPVFDWTGNVATTPITILYVTAGTHRITFRKQGYFDEDVYVLVQNGLYSDASAVLRLHMAVTTTSQEDIYLPEEEICLQEEDIYISEQDLQPKQRGIVRFDTQPRGAIIIVDGQYILDPDTEEYIRTPTTVLLFEGRRDFTLRLEGHQDMYGYVDVFAGSRVNIFRNLEPIPGSNIRSTQYPYNYPGVGDILIDSEPQGAYIYIDSIPMTDTMGNSILTPVRVTGLMEGLHEVRIAKDGYYEKQIIVNVISGFVAQIFTKLQSIYE